MKLLLVVVLLIITIVSVFSFKTAIKILADMLTKVYEETPEFFDDL